MAAASHKRIGITTISAPAGQRVTAYRELPDSQWRPALVTMELTTRPISICQDDLGRFCHPFLPPHLGQPVYALRFANGTEWEIPSA